MASVLKGLNFNEFTDINVKIYAAKISELCFCCTNLSNLAWTEQDGRDERLDTREPGGRIERDLTHKAVSESVPSY
jgi:hypothetical protein